VPLPVIDDETVPPRPVVAASESAGDADRV
jgi:hypothetical protein